MYVDAYSYLGDACNYDLLFSSQEMGHYESRSIPDSGMSILCDAFRHSMSSAERAINDPCLPDRLNYSPLSHSTSKAS